MPKSDRNAIIIVICAFAAIIVCPILFTGPALANFLCFTETGQIGDTIGGITAPIVGLCSILLLYYTLKEQINFNKDQAKDNRVSQLLSIQSDIIQMNERIKFKFKKNLSGSSSEEVEVSGLCSLCLLESFNDYKPQIELNQCRYLKDELRVFLELCCHYFNYLNDPIGQQASGDNVDSKVVITYLQELERFCKNVVSGKVNIIAGLLDSCQVPGDKVIVSEVNIIREEFREMLEIIDSVKK